MTKWIYLIALVLVAVSAVFLVWHTSGPGIAARPVKLTITGSGSQRFTGSYTADGKTNVLSGVVPTTVDVRAKELTYDFKPADAGEEFRVALDVENLHRASFIRYKGGLVKGGWRCWNGGESAW